MYQVLALIVLVGMEPLDAVREMLDGVENEDEVVLRLVAGI